MARTRINIHTNVVNFTGDVSPTNGVSTVESFTVARPSLGDAIAKVFTDFVGRALGRGATTVEISSGLVGDRGTRTSVADSAAQMRSALQETGFSVIPGDGFPIDVNVRGNQQQ